MIWFQNQTARGHPDLKIGEFVTLCAPNVLNISPQNDEL